jgi:Bacterial Ig domain
VLTVDVPDSVLVNDELPAIPPIFGWTESLVPLSGPSNGVVSFDPVGSYTPNPGFVGTDMFSYTVNPVISTADVDSAGVPLQATVTIFVTNAPPAARPDSYTTPQDTTLLVPPPGVFANDFDTDGDPLSIDSILTPPSHGSLTLSFSSGGITYVPDPGFVGTDTFVYLLHDSFAVTSSDVTRSGLGSSANGHHRGDRFGANNDTEDDINAGADTAPRSDRDDRTR